MKNKHKTIALIIVAVAAVCLIVPLAKSLHSTSSYISVIEKNWNIELPKDGAEDIYSYSEPSFHGDGIRYHVIDYPIGNESKKIQESVFQLEKNFNSATVPTAEQVEYAEQLIEDIDITEDVLPNWDRCRLIYQKQIDKSELFLFYSAEDGTIYVVESFL